MADSLTDEELEELYESSPEEIEARILQEVSNAGISREELIRDMERLDQFADTYKDRLAALDKLPPEEQAAGRVKVAADYYAITEKYKNTPIMQIVIDDTLPEEDIVEILAETNRSDARAERDAADPAARSDEVELKSGLEGYEGDMPELRALYERTLDMDGLSDAEKLERYDAFLEELTQLGYKIVGNDAENMDDISEKIFLQLGMPDYIFPDMMAEYTDLKGKEIKDLLDRADTYSRLDAMEELQAGGNESPSEQEINEHYLQTRLDLFEKAQTLDEKFTDSIFADEYMTGQIELSGGYTREYIAREIEATKLEIEQLEYAPAHERYVEIQQTPPQNNTASDPEPAASPAFDPAPKAGPGMG